MRSSSEHCVSHIQGKGISPKIGMTPTATQHSQMTVHRQVAIHQDVNTPTAGTLVRPRLPPIKVLCLAPPTRSVSLFARLSIRAVGWPTTPEKHATRHIAHTKSAEVFCRHSSRRPRRRLHHHLRHHPQRMPTLIQTAHRATLKRERHGAGMLWVVSRAIRKA